MVKMCETVNISKVEIWKCRTSRKTIWKPHEVQNIKKLEDFQNIHRTSTTETRVVAADNV